MVEVRSHGTHIRQIPIEAADIGGRSEVIHHQVVGVTGARGPFDAPQGRELPVSVECVGLSLHVFELGEREPRIVIRHRIEVHLCHITGVPVGHLRSLLSVRIRRVAVQITPVVVVFVADPGGDLRDPVAVLNQRIFLLANVTNAWMRYQHLERLPAVPGVYRIQVRRPFPIALLGHRGLATGSKAADDDGIAGRKVHLGFYFHVPGELLAPLRRQDPHHRHDSQAGIRLFLPDSTVGSDISEKEDTVGTGGQVEGNHSRRTPGAVARFRVSVTSFVIQEERDIDSLQARHGTHDLDLGPGRLEGEQDLGPRVRAVRFHGPP